MTIENRPVRLRAWRYNLKGVTGAVVPVYLLDSDLEENSAWDRTLTDSLYGGDNHYRLCQEVILGIGGVKMLRALGHNKIARFHMNEGDASLLTVALLDEQARLEGRTALTGRTSRRSAGNASLPRTHLSLGATTDSRWKR